MGKTAGQSDEAVSASFRTTDKTLDTIPLKEIPPNLIEFFVDIRHSQEVARDLSKHITKLNALSNEQEDAFQNAKHDLEMIDAEISKQGAKLPYKNDYQRNIAEGPGCSARSS
jgi:predicted nucleotide-binding protein (sugar kinase/HSP70/actin superfamily)